MAKLTAKKPHARIPVRDYIREYVSLCEEEKRIKQRKDVLASALKKYALENGETNDKGSSYFERDNYVVGNIARKSISFDVEKAIKFFRRRGYPECVKEVEVIDESAVEELISTGEISLGDLESITQTKVSYSISVKPVEEVTDVQESRVNKRSSRGRSA